MLIINKKISVFFNYDKLMDCDQFQTKITNNIFNVSLIQINFIAVKIFNAQIISNPSY
jgi:hypothetical protein